MRTGYVSTAALSQALRTATMRQQAELVTAQKEAQCGLSADLGLKLGANAGKAVSLDRDLQRLGGLIDSNGLIAKRLSATQEALGQIANTGQGFVNTLSAALSGQIDTTVLRTTARGALDAVTSSLNASFNGEYLFAGANTDVRPVAPYADSPASAGKAAIDSAFQSWFGFAPSDPAAGGIDNAAMTAFLQNGLPAVFSGPSWSSNWSSASDEPIIGRIALNETAATSVTANRQPLQDMVMATSMVTDLLGIPDLSEGARQAVLKNALELASGASAGVTALQAETGVMENRVKNATDRLSAQQDLFETSLADLQSVDPYEASLRVTSLQTQIEASYSLTARIQQLSLLKFIT